MLSLLKLFNYLNILTPQVSVYLRTLSFLRVHLFHWRIWSTNFLNRFFEKFKIWTITFRFGYSAHFKYSYFDAHWASTVWLPQSQSISPVNLKFAVLAKYSSKLSISRFRHPTSAFSKMESLKYELLHSTWVAVFGIRIVMVFFNFKCNLFP